MPVISVRDAVEILNIHLLFSSGLPSSCILLVRSQNTLPTLTIPMRTRPTKWLWLWRLKVNTHSTDRYIELKYMCSILLNSYQITDQLLVEWEYWHIYANFLCAWTVLSPTTTGEAASEATATVKFNRQKYNVEADLQIPDYDLEVGLRLGSVNPDTKGKATHSVQIDLVNKNIPQASLVALAKYVKWYLIWRCKICEHCFIRSCYDRS